MKERIVLDFGAELENICNGCAEGVKAKCKQTQKDHLQCALQKSELEEFEVEKYPKSWEELKELVKQKVKEDNHNGIKEDFGSIEYILIDDKSFLPTGEILDEDNDVFAVNRTPQQMWQIIIGLLWEK